MKYKHFWLWKKMIRLAFIGFARSYAVGAPIPILTSEADVTFDREWAASFSGSHSIEAGGDFDGDGFDDIAMVKGGDVHVIRGKPFPRQGAWSSHVDLTISHQGSFTGSLKATDLDGDGKDDLVLMSPSNSEIPTIKIIYGRKPFQGIVDLGITPADLTLRAALGSGLGLAQSIASGDVNGDGRRDLVMGAPTADPLGRQNAGEVYLLWGCEGRRTGTLDVTVSTEVVVFQGPVGGALGMTVLVGNIFGNGPRDLVLSAPMASFLGRAYAGKIFVVKGTERNTFPSAWDLESTPTDMVIYGIPDRTQMRAQVLGNFSGIGSDDLLFRDTFFNALFTAPQLTSGQPVIDRLPTSPDYLSEILFPQFGEISSGDFDGDGRKDYFGIMLNDEVGVCLSHDYPVSPVFSVSDFSLRVIPSRGKILSYSAGDVNGDRNMDLVLFDIPLFAGTLLTSAVHVVYGFRPLENPSLVIQESATETTAVTLNLKVDGDPSEVRVDGDVADEWRGRWVPFRNALRVRLTSEPGSKTVRTTFRNRFHRESAEVMDTVVLSPGPPRTQTLTNVMRAGSGSEVIVECNVTEATHIQASVFDRRGERVAHVLDEERGPGVWPVKWWGLNDHGQPVAPGVYVLIIEANGRVEKHNIVVRG